MHLVERRIPVIVTGLAILAALVVGLFVALGLRSVVAGPDSGPAAAAPNPGHEWSEIGLPVGTWPGLDADTVDGMDTGQSGTNYIPYADASGNVGVGTTIPVSKLHIEGSFPSGADYAGLRIKSTDTASYRHSIIWMECSSTSNRCQPGIIFARPSGTKWEISQGAGDIAADVLGFMRHGLGTVAVIDPSGNVGIGTTTPNAKLQVVGGDGAITTQGRGLILRATDGSNCYRLTVNNAGTLGTALVSCP